MDCRQEIVLPVVEHIVVYRHTGSHKLGYAALHKLLGSLGVFELLADGHTLSGAHQFGQICVEGMMWESGKLDILCRAVGAPCQGYPEYLGCCNRIIGKSLIEIAYTKEQYRIGMLLFHRQILLHERSLHDCFCHTFYRLFDFCNLKITEFF